MSNPLEIIGAYLTEVQMDKDAAKKQLKVRVRYLPEETSKLDLLRAIDIYSEKLQSNSSKASRNIFNIFVVPSILLYMILWIKVIEMHNKGIPCSMETVVMATPFFIWALQIVMNYGVGVYKSANHILSELRDIVEEEIVI